MSRSSARVRRPQRKLRLSSDTAAFSLVELLVAMAILVLVVVVLSQILGSTQNLWRQSENRADPFRDARAALEVMSTDIARALLHDRAPVLVFESLYTQPADPTGGTNNNQVYALGPVPPSAQGTGARSDICAVGFYCSWDAQRRAYVLRRHFVSSSNTLGILQTAFNNSTPPTPITPVSIFKPSHPAAAPAQDEDIAAYVWNLKVVPHDYTLGANPTANTTYPMTYRNVLPAYVTVSFSAMSPQAARQLASQNVTPTVWFTPGDAIYKNQILPNSQVFSARIALRNAVRP